MRTTGGQDVPDHDLESRERTTWDLLAAELRTLRASVGNPSYATIAEIVADRRVAEGASVHAARVARSTVYDCFRAGRTRGNLGLVREIAAALGGAPDEVDRWLAGAARRSPARPSTPGSVTREPEPAPPAEIGRPRTVHVLVLLAGCVAANLLGRQFEELLHLPIHLDMVGTAVAAIALGPWRGAAVGGLTNTLGVAISGWVSLPFALVNVAGALVWGYGVRRWGLGRSLPRFFLLCLLVAVVCSAVAVPILTVLYGGSTGHGQDSVRDQLAALTDTLVAIGFANLLVSVGDKVISGFVALVGVAALPATLRRDLPLAFASTAHPAAAGARRDA